MPPMNPGLFRSFVSMFSDLKTNPPFTWVLFNLKSVSLLPHKSSFCFCFFISIEVKFFLAQQFVSCLFKMASVSSLLLFPLCVLIKKDRRQGKGTVGLIQLLPNLAHFIPSAFFSLCITCLGMRKKGVYWREICQGNSPWAASWPLTMRLPLPFWPHCSKAKEAPNSAANTTSTGEREGEEKKVRETRTNRQTDRQTDR